MKVKNGQIQVTNECKFWEFCAFLAEVSDHWEYDDVMKPTNRQMAIGFMRYHKNRKRHLNPNSRFMKMRQAIRTH